MRATIFRNLVFSPSYFFLQHYCFWQLKENFPLWFHWVIWSFNLGSQYASRNVPTLLSSLQSPFWLFLKSNTVAHISFRLDIHEVILRSRLVCFAAFMTFLPKYGRGWKRFQLESMVTEQGSRSNVYIPRRPSYWFPDMLAVYSTCTCFLAFINPQWKLRWFSECCSNSLLLASVYSIRALF